MNKTKHTIELSREVFIREIHHSQGLKQSIQANKSECKSLAKRLNVASIEKLEANITFSYSCDDTIINCEGLLHAEVTQSCVISSKPVSEVIEHAFKAIFTTSSKNIIEKHDQSDIETLMPTDDEAPELIREDKIDVGELVAQNLSLSISPYLRHPDSSFDDEIEEKKINLDRKNAFSILKTLDTDKK